MERTSMLSFIQSILVRPYSPSSTAGQKRKRSTSPATTEQSVNVDTSSVVARRENGDDTEMALDQEAAIASFLALPDGPLVKRTRTGDDEDDSGGVVQGKSGRLSIIREVVEEDHEGAGGASTCMKISKSADGQHGGQSRGSDNKDVDMEDVDLGVMEAEQGLWTYRGGNSFQR